MHHPLVAVEGVVGHQLLQQAGRQLTPLEGNYRVAVSMSLEARHADRAPGHKLFMEGEPA